MDDQRDLIVVSENLHLHLPRTRAAFPGLTQELDGWLERHGVGERASYVAHLVLEEVVRNLVEHARGGAGTIEVEAEAHASGVELRVVDDCDPFDPRGAPPPDRKAPLAGRRAGGMGLHLLATMTQAMRYERKGGRNVLEVDIADTL